VHINNHGVTIFCGTMMLLSNLFYGSISTQSLLTTNLYVDLSVISLSFFMVLFSIGECVTCYNSQLSFNNP